MVQVHVTPPHPFPRSSPCVGPVSPAGPWLGPYSGSGGLLSCRTPAVSRSVSAGRDLNVIEVEGFLVVKKLLVVILLGLAAFAVWRKVQSDRAELDLWTEATAADDD